MSGAVDVLGRIEAAWGKDSDEYAAVFGLIDALEVAQLAMSIHMWNSTLPYVRRGVYAHDIKIVAAALARCKGEAE